MTLESPLAFGCCFSLIALNYDVLDLITLRHN
mgnify:CR=1 FL=1|jgi:hypothetical protein